MNTSVNSSIEPRDTPPETENETELLIAGTVERITFSNPDNGYCVLRLNPAEKMPYRYVNAKGQVTLVGVMPGVDAGLLIKAGGQWIVDPKWGHQFRVAWYKPTRPSDEQGIVAYLASGNVKGIGPVMAQRIVDRFGKDTFRVLDEDIDRLAEVPKVGGKTLARIKENWLKAEGDRELVAFLGEHGIAPGLAPRLIKVYGKNALAKVIDNPYRLCADIRGIGFRRADAIAQKIGVAPDAPERIAAAVIHILESLSGEGHTGWPREAARDEVVKLIEVEQEKIEFAIDQLVINHKLVLDEVNGVPAVFLRVLHDAEGRIADRLEKLRNSPKKLPAIEAIDALADFEQRTRFQLAAAQREAVLQFLREGMMILTGGPGTGKTTTLRAIIELFEMGKRKVKLASPTGRASRRLQETANRPAETIHRLLGYQAHQQTFQHDATNPIEGDLLIIDEASMLDVQLAASLFEALPSRACLLLVGDEDQLPSVGPGNVLGDLIAAAPFGVARLTEIFRQAGESLIVTNAHRINKGLMPLLDPPADASREPDFFFIERDDPAQVIETIKTMAADRIPSKFRFDPKRDIQILTPMRRGELGVESINEAMQALLNPPPRDDEAPATRLRPGDRIMQTSNNYDKNVFNGDIGHIRQIDTESEEVWVDFEGRETVSYLPDEGLDQLQLAYATTIHKSQGSEFPAVIIPVHTQHWIMLQRNLIYTALTRARRLAIFVGTKKALRRAVGNADMTKRFTLLRHIMKGE